MNDQASAPEKAPPKSLHGQGLGHFIELLPAWARAFVAVGFIFTIWSVFTGFDLGNIMNKYADASLEQNKMQFEAQLQMQNLQFEATETSNHKLDVLIASVESVNEKIANQAAQIASLATRMGTLETTVGRLARWSCTHEGADAPAYCAALVETRD